MQGSNLIVWPLNLNRLVDWSHNMVWLRNKKKSLRASHLSFCSFQNVKYSFKDVWDYFFRIDCHLLNSDGATDKMNYSNNSFKQKANCLIIPSKPYRVDNLIESSQLYDSIKWSYLRLCHWIKKKFSWKFLSINPC